MYLGKQITAVGEDVATFARDDLEPGRALAASPAAVNLGKFLQGEKTLRLDNADKLAALLGLQLVHDPYAIPPEPTPENLARPMLAKDKTKRKVK